jgi:SAM-dependent methyltransferase
MDISKQAIEVARDGVYSPAVSEITGTDIVDGMTEGEIEELFDKKLDVLTVKPWIKQGIDWHVGDAMQAEILDVLGPQDIVVANNFLCHMDPSSAESCLRNIARLVTPGGFLFVSGIDLDVRTKVAADSGWTPLQEMLEEIHYGDPRMEGGWPWNYSSLEPLNKKRRDWKLRYAATFQLVCRGEITDSFVDVRCGAKAARTGGIDGEVATTARFTSSELSDARSDGLSTKSLTAPSEHA